MKHEKLLRAALLAAVCALHILLILFLAFDTSAGPAADDEERARVMKLVDVDELPPPPPEELPQVEAIAETMIETDTEPLQIVVAPGTLNITPVIEEDYVAQNKLTVIPKIDEKEIIAKLKYPPIAQRSGIEGRVILDLFIDRSGMITKALILKEDPPDRGFGEAAVQAFTGIRGIPAQANGEAVACRYRWPVRFVLK